MRISATGRVRMPGYDANRIPFVMQKTHDPAPGIVLSYAIIIRETMPAGEAATRVGTVIMASELGMSFRGWISGVIFDMTGSYQAAFLNGPCVERAEYQHSAHVAVTFTPPRRLRLSRIEGKATLWPFS